MSRKFPCGVDEEVEEHEELLQKLLKLDSNEALCAFMIDRLRKAARRMRDQRDSEQSRLQFSAWINLTVAGRVLDEHQRMHYQADHLRVEVIDVDARLTDRFADLLAEWLEDDALPCGEEEEEVLPSIFPEEKS